MEFDFIISSKKLIKMIKENQYADMACDIKPIVDYWAYMPVTPEILLNCAKDIAYKTSIIADDKAYDLKLIADIYQHLAHECIRSLD